SAAPGRARAARRHHGAEAPRGHRFRSSRLRACEPFGSGEEGGRRRQPCPRHPRCVGEGGWPATDAPPITRGAMKTLKGTMTALATPFKDGQLDESAYRELIRTQLGGGVNGLVPVGTTGEAVTLSSDECARLTRIAVEEAKG